MKIKVITSYKPGTWDLYSGRGIKSIAEQWPSEIDLVVYLEEPKPNYDHPRITWIELNAAEPELLKFYRSLHINLSSLVNKLLKDYKDEKYKNM